MSLWELMTHICVMVGKGLTDLSNSLPTVVNSLIKEAENPVQTIITLYKPKFYGLIGYNVN